jgi:pectate lyase
MYKLIILLLLSFQALAAPDVIVTSLDYDNGKFTSVLKNQGSTATPTTYISVSFLIVGVEHSYGKVMGSIAPGATLTLSSTNAKPLTSGSYVVTAFADNMNRIAESDEANNRLTKIITVESPIAPPPTSAIQGFAAVAKVTGGAGGKNIVVTNCKGDLSAGSLKAAIAVNATRTITFKPGMSCVITWPEAAGCAHVNTPNMTIDGAGANITVSGMALNVFSNGSVSPTHNVIIRNLTFGNTTPNRSPIMIAYGSYNVWVDHNTFYNNSSGSISGQPVGIWNHSTTNATNAPRGLTGITLSWNHYRTPNGRGVLLGSESHNTGNTVTLYGRVSSHHNWYEGVGSRMPRAHSKGNLIHEWNNYVSGRWSEMPVAISQGSSYLGEGNIYEPGGPTYQVTANHDYYYPKDTAEGLLQRTPLLLNGAKSTNFGTFPMNKITYTATIEPATTVLRDRIKQNAGANRSGL